MANFIFMLVFNLMISASFAGTEIQNGGDSSVAEFKNFAREVVYSLPDKLLNDLSQKSKNDLFNIIKNANVLCGDELQIGNSSKEAINYPFETPQRIVLDCKKFRSNSSIYAKYSLVIHEFLFLAFIDDSDYETSSKLIDVFFKLRNNNDSFSKDLVWQASDCNLIQFQNDVELGGNIYFRNQESTTPLKAAIQSGCLLIINELLKMGVVPETSIDIYGAISYLLARSIKSDCNNNDNHCRDVTLSEARLLKLKVILIKSSVY